VLPFLVVGSIRVYTVTPRILIVYMAGTILYW
jgi:hypothetical protein